MAGHASTYTYLYILILHILYILVYNLYILDTLVRLDQYSLKLFCWVETFINSHVAQVYYTNCVSRLL